MLAPLIEDKKDEIAALCRRFRVRVLWAFGSATTERFDPETSDMDFLVDLGESGEDIARRFFGLRRELADLFGRDVDLATIAGLARSPVGERILDSRIRMYDARLDDLAA